MQPQSEPFVAMHGRPETGLASAAWKDRYLKLLGLEPAAPTLGYLARITRAHVQRVPFENITSVLRRRAYGSQPVPELDLEETLAAWEQRTAGGVCFISAHMARHLLDALGYECFTVLAQNTFPGSHQAVLAQVEGHPFLVDIAAGAPFFEPIPLDTVTEIHLLGLGYRFGPGEAADTWQQQRLLQGDWVPFNHYDLREPTVAAQDTARQRHHTPGRSWVVDAIRLIKIEERRVVALWNKNLTRFTPKGKVSVVLNDTSDIPRVVRDEMGLNHLPVEECLSALEERGAGPFA